MAKISMTSPTPPAAQFLVSSSLTYLSLFISFFFYFYLFSGFDLCFLLWVAFNFLFFGFILKIVAPLSLINRMLM